jgi:hypothetical protein
MERKKRNKTTPKQTIEFDFIKSNYFRSIRVDGVFGGLAPNGSVHMAAFTERQAIPQKMVHEIEGNVVGPEITANRQGRTAIVREIEVDLIFDYSIAVVMRDWLSSKISQYEQLATTNHPRDK